MEKKRFVGSNSNVIWCFVILTRQTCGQWFIGSNPNVIFWFVILTRQTCGQRSSMSAEGKRRALAFCFSIRNCHIFLISKCTGESDLGLCMNSRLAQRMRLRTFDFKTRFAASLDLSEVAKLCRWNYLDYLRNEAKCGDMAVLEIKFGVWVLGKWSKVDHATSISFVPYTLSQR